MINLADFQPGSCPRDDYLFGPPLTPERDLIVGHDPADAESLYVVMFALESTLLHRQEAAQHIGQVTAKRQLNADFYAVTFTAYDTDREPLVEADTLFQGGSLLRPMNIMKPLRLGRQNIVGAYFTEQLPAAPAALSEAEPQRQPILPRILRRPAPAFSGLQA